MECAPDWYSTPLRQSGFEWPPEEKLERYCQRILNNVTEEEMTPRQRFKVIMKGRARGRLLLEALYFNLYAVRTI